MVIVRSHIAQHRSRLWVDVPQVPRWVREWKERRVASRDMLVVAHRPYEPPPARIASSLKLDPVAKDTRHRAVAARMAVAVVVRREAKVAVAAVMRTCRHLAVATWVVVTSQAAVAMVAAGTDKRLCH